VKGFSSTAAIVAAKFILLNHVPLTLMVMVVVGLASSGALSPPSVEASFQSRHRLHSLVTSGTLLLHNMVKLVAVLRQKWCRTQEQEDARHGGRDRFY
jgi:hypothetical protein